MIALKIVSHPAPLWLAAARAPDGKAAFGHDASQDVGMRPLRVLIVEDEFYISLHTRGLLQALGHVVVAVAVSVARWYRSDDFNPRDFEGDRYDFDEVNISASTTAVAVTQGPVVPQVVALEPGGLRMVDELGPGSFFPSSSSWSELRASPFGWDSDVLAYGGSSWEMFQVLDGDGTTGGTFTSTIRDALPWVTGGGA